MAKIKTQTPIGTFKFVYITRKDTKFGGKDFKLTIETEKDKAIDFLTTVKQMAIEEFGEEGWKKMVSDLDKYERAYKPYKINKEEGTVEIRAKSQYMPMLFDAKGKPIDKDNAPRVGSGSKGRMKIVLEPYGTVKSNKFGISARLNHVQIAKLVEYVPGGGFEEVDDDMLDDDDEAFDQEQTSYTAIETRNLDDNGDEANEDDDDEGFEDEDDFDLGDDDSDF